tara:strand:+ start:295 stop:648 length:354 start_codon:yes stop_codon:yes gene_type:complete
LAAFECLNNNHHAAAFRACLFLLVGVGTLIVVGLRISIRVYVKQSPDLLDPVAPNAIRKEACVSDTMEAGGQDMDQEPPDELRRGKPHDLHSIAGFDPVVFPPEGYGVCIGANQAVV